MKRKITAQLEESLKQAAVLARSMQLFYHDAHNETGGGSFFPDHDFFNEAYDTLTGDYDTLAEYLVAGGASVKDIKTSIEIWDEGEDFFATALEIEDSFRQILTQLNEISPVGLQNAIGDMMQKSDVRTYKMQQRTKATAAVIAALSELV